MPSTRIVRTTDVNRSVRVAQVEGIFSIQPSERNAVEWDVSFDLPDEWNIGLIVGPSGSGKTTVARELFGEHIVDGWEWGKDTSLLDSFPEDMSIKDITALLSSVGFSTPASWVRPFHVLSNGEQFRVNMARTMAEMRDGVAVVDEFTSVVDRTVAQIGSAAIAKTIRRRKQQLIAVTCHYDVAEWLEPDWVYQPHTGAFEAGRSLRRPTINLTVRRVHYQAWKIFGTYHYLDHDINHASHCYCAFINDQPVAFCAVLPHPHATKPGWRFHRLVCLPDYQGVGIGSVLADHVGSIFAASGKPVYRTLAHPAVIHAANKSPNWHMYRKPSASPKQGKNSIRKDDISVARDRLIAGFRYVGPAIPQQDAIKIWGVVKPKKKKPTKGSLRI